MGTRSIARLCHHFGRRLGATVIAASTFAASACGDDPVQATADTATNSDTASGADADAATSDRPDTPTPWIFEDDTVVATPDLAPADLQAAVEAALNAALELDPQVVKDLHDLLYPAPEPGSGDPSGCPFFLTYDYGNAWAFYWQGECTNEEGTSYSGYGYASWYDDYPVEYGTIDGFEYYLAGRIEAADGTWMEGAGDVTAYEGGGGDLDGFTRVVDGTFRAGGPRAPKSPWLDGTRRPSLTVSGWRYLPTGGKNLMFSGGIGGLADFPGDVTAVALDDLMVRTISAGSACEKEFGGSASVRGPDGSWYDIIFDGPSDEEPDTTPAELCDGCGETFFRGQGLDATCLPAAPYTAWELRPW